MRQPPHPDPALNSLSVHVRASGQITNRHTGTHHRGTQALVHKPILNGPSGTFQALCGTFDQSRDVLARPARGLQRPKHARLTDPVAIATNGDQGPVPENSRRAAPSSPPILARAEVTRRMLLLAELQDALAPLGVRSVLARNHRLVLQYNHSPCEPSGLTNPSCTSLPRTASTSPPLTSPPPMAAPTGWPAATNAPLATRPQQLPSYGTARPPHPSLTARAPPQTPARRSS